MSEIVFCQSTGKGTTKIGNMQIFFKKKMCLYRKMKINLRMSEKNSTFAGLFCANVRVCACEYSNGK